MRELILEKYDLKNTLEIMEKIKQEIITIKYVRVSEFSAIAKPIFDYARTFAALPLTVEKSIIELVKNNEWLKNESFQKGDIFFTEKY